MWLCGEMVVLGDICGACCRFITRLGCDIAIDLWDTGVEAAVG